MVAGTASVNTNFATKFKEQQKRQEIETLQREIKNIYNVIKELEGKEITIWGQKKKLIQDIALDYERLHELGTYTQPLSTVCRQIKQDMADNHLDTSPSWIESVLDSRFKSHQDYDRNPRDFGEGEEEKSGLLIGEQQNHQEGDDETLIDPENGSPRFTHIEESGVPGPDAEFRAFYTPSKVDYVSSTTNSRLFSPPQHLQQHHQESQEPRAPEMPLPNQPLTKEQIREGCEYYIKLKKKRKEELREISRREEYWREKAITNRIAIDPELEDPSMFEEQISTIVGESGVSQLSNELRLYGGDIIKTAEKVEKFKPNDADAAQWAKSIHYMRKMWKPWIDEKWAEDTFGWWQIQKTNIGHGKHAAAKMNEIFIREGMKRALTREQVGDAMERIINQNLEFCQAFEDLADLNLWYLKYVRKQVGERRFNMHEKLSDRSIG